MSTKTKGKYHNLVSKGGSYKGSKVFSGSGTGKIKDSVVSEESIYNRIGPESVKVEWPFKSIPDPTPKGRGEYEGAEVIFVAKEDWENLVDFLEDLRALERFERIKEEPPEAFLDLEELKRRALDNRIKEVRRDKGITQVGLAEKLGCKQSYISKIERHDYRPRFDTLKRVAKALGCSVEDLI